jgi:hypothetical protein
VRKNLPNVVAYKAVPRQEETGASDGIYSVKDSVSSAIVAAPLRTSVFMNFELNASQQRV